MVVRRKFNYMNLLLGLVFSLGLGILLYPNISNYFNERNSSKATSVYDETVSQMKEEEKQEYFKTTTEYNSTLVQNPIGRFSDMTDAELEEYNRLLNVDGKGMMCYLKIDKLDVNLPVYHGTTEEVLQKYVGHVEGSSLPIGGLGTHCALSGHRGLPNAVLFTNLDRMEVGDYFTIIVLGEEHVYQVDQILTVLPNDMSPLEIDVDKDFCTLITCTPYGVNTHRLMVRGVRIPDEKVEEVIEEHTEKIGLTREKIVNIIAGVLTVAFIGVGGWFILFPATVKRQVLLRPWDDTINDVYDSAIKVAERSTRANWAMDDITREADHLARQRRWDDTLKNVNKMSSEDIAREWNEYEYDDTSTLSEEEVNNYREWDNEVLDKVDQDWSPFDVDYHKKVFKFRRIDEILKTGRIDPDIVDRKPFYEQEMTKGKELLKTMRKIKKT